jgi:hypothetical protein
MDYIFLNSDTVYRQGVILRAPLTNGAVTIMSFNRMYLGEKTLRHERRKFRLSCLPIGALASAFVAVAVAGAEPGSAKIAAAPSSEEPVQLVPAEAQPAKVAPATSQEAASQEAASVEPQVAQSGEGEAKDAQEEPEAFPLRR